MHGALVLHGHSGARAKLANPESITLSRGYGFRITALRAVSGMTAEYVDRPPKASSALAPVHLVGALLERAGEAAERNVEHAAHQHAEHAALELVVDEELDIATGLAGRHERPAVLHPAEWALQILDQNLQLRPVE